MQCKLDKRSSGKSYFFQAPAWDCFVANEKKEIDVQRRRRRRPVCLSGGCGSGSSGDGIGGYGGRCPRLVCLILLRQLLTMTVISLELP